MIDQKPQHPAEVIGDAHDMILLIALTMGINNLYKVSAVCKRFADTISIRFPYNADHKLLYNRKLWSKTTVLCAARNGHLEVLQWLMTENCPWYAKACNVAAKYGHIKVLKWLRDNGCDWCPRTCSNAAENGHLEVLMWARVNGCDWFENTICASASIHGHLDVLVWLQTEGCILHRDACTFAERNGHDAVVAWLKKNGCPEQ
jgi:hypothetical protein